MITTALHVIDPQPTGGDRCLIVDRNGSNNDEAPHSATRVILGKNKKALNQHFQAQAEGKRQSHMGSHGCSEYEFSAVVNNNAKAFYQESVAPVVGTVSKGIAPLPPGYLSGANDAEIPPQESATIFIHGHSPDPNGTLSTGGYHHSSSGHPSDPKHALFETVISETLTDMQLNVARGNSLGPQPTFSSQHGEDPSSSSTSELQLHVSFLDFYGPWGVVDLFDEKSPAHDPSNNGAKMLQANKSSLASHPVHNLDSTAIAVTSVEEIEGRILPWIKVKRTPRALYTAKAMEDHRHTAHLVITARIVSVERSHSPGASEGVRRGREVDRSMGGGRRSSSTGGRKATFVRSDSSGGQIHQEGENDEDFDEGHTGDVDPNGVTLATVHIVKLADFDKSNAKNKQAIEFEALASALKTIGQEAKRQQRNSEGNSSSIGGGNRSRSAGSLGRGNHSYFSQPASNSHHQHLPLRESKMLLYLQHELLGGATNLIDSDGRVGAASHSDPNNFSLSQQQPGGGAGVKSTAPLSHIVFGVAVNSSVGNYRQVAAACHFVTRITTSPSSYAYYHHLESGGHHFPHNHQTSHSRNLQHKQHQLLNSSNAGSASGGTNPYSSRPGSRQHNSSSLTHRHYYDDATTDVSEEYSYAIHHPQQPHGTDTSIVSGAGKRVQVSSPLRRTQETSLGTPSRPHPQGPESDFSPAGRDRGVATSTTTFDRTSSRQNKYQEVHSERWASSVVTNNSASSQASRPFEPVSASSQSQAGRPGPSNTSTAGDGSRSWRIPNTKLREEARRQEELFYGKKSADFSLMSQRSDDVHHDSSSSAFRPATIPQEPHRSQMLDTSNNVSAIPPSATATPPRSGMDHQANTSASLQVSILPQSPPQRQPQSPRGELDSDGLSTTRSPRQALPQQDGINRTPPSSKQSYHLEEENTVAGDSSVLSPRPMSMAEKMKLREEERRRNEEVAGIRPGPHQQEQAEVLNDATLAAAMLKVENDTLREQMMDMVEAVKRITYERDSLLDGRRGRIEALRVTPSAVPTDGTRGGSTGGISAPTTLGRRGGSGAPAGGLGWGNLPIAAGAPQITPREMTPVEYRDVSNERGTSITIQSVSKGVAATGQANNDVATATTTAPVSPSRGVDSSAASMVGAATQGNLEDLETANRLIAKLRRQIKILQHRCEAVVTENLEIKRDLPVLLTDLRNTLAEKEDLKRKLGSKENELRIRLGSVVRERDEAWNHRNSLELQIEHERKQHEDQVQQLERLVTELRSVRQHRESTMITQVTSASSISAVSPQKVSPSSSTPAGSKAAQLLLIEKVKNEVTSEMETRIQKEREQWRNDLKKERQLRTDAELKNLQNTMEMEELKSRLDDITNTTAPLLGEALADLVLASSPQNSPRERTQGGGGLSTVVPTTTAPGNANSSSSSEQAVELRDLDDTYSDDDFEQ